MEDLLVYGRALGTGEGLLTPEQQAERLNSFLGDPRRSAPTKTTGSASLMITGGSDTPVSYLGSTPLSTTIPSLTLRLVVEVNSDIPSGDCPPDRPTMTDAPHEDIPCADPADRIFGAVAEALGEPVGTEQ